MTSPARLTAATRRSGAVGNSAVPAKSLCGVPPVICPDAGDGGRFRHHAAFVPKTLALLAA